MRGVEAPGCTVHIVAPFGRDAESIAVILDRQDLSVCIHDSLAQMARQLDDSAGVVVLTEEAVSGDVEALTAALQAQPPWSDIPFVLLRSSRGAYYNRHTTLPAAAINVIELERPLGAVSLQSAISTALRSRQKQFVIRDQMAQLAESQAALALSEAELRRVTDALPVLIAFIDKHLIYRFANQAYEVWIGQSPAAVVGRSLDEVIGRADLLTQVSRGSAFLDDLDLNPLLITVDGSEKIVYDRSKPRNAVMDTLDAEIARDAGNLMRAGAPDKAVATSKTFRSLARLTGAAPSGAGPRVKRTLTAAGLRQLIAFISRMTASDRAELEGVSADRAPQIVAGALVAPVVGFVGPELPGTAQAIDIGVIAGFAILRLGASLAAVVALIVFVVLRRILR